MRSSFVKSAIGFIFSLILYICSMPARADNEAYYDTESEAYSACQAQLAVILSYYYPPSAPHHYPIYSACTYQSHPSYAGYFFLNTGLGGAEFYFNKYSFAGTPGKNAGKPCPCVGDPINPGTGNEYADEQDLALGWLSLHRYYNSQIEVTSANLGPNWRHTFDRSVLYNGRATVFRPDGRQLIFNRPGVGNIYIGDSDVPDRLSRVANASGVYSGWIYYDASSNSQEYFDANGLLTSIVGPDQKIIALTYSITSTPTSIAPKAGLLLTVTDPIGRQLSFKYDSSSRISSIALPDGKVLTYSYDDAGNLAQVTYPDASSRKYLYNEAGLGAGPNYPAALTGIVAEDGSRYASIGYESSGRAISSVIAGNVNPVQVAYSADGSAGITYATGAQASMGFTVSKGSVHASAVSAPCGPACGVTYAARTFDNNGYMATSTDFNGHVSQFTYDSNGLLNKEVVAAGENSQRTTVTAWNTAQRVPLSRTITDATGVVWSRKSWAYNAVGQTIASCDVDPTQDSSYACLATGVAPAGVKQTAYTYCNAVDATECPLIALLLSVDGPRTDVADTTSYSYYMATDESGCGTSGGACHRAGDLYQVTDALGHVVTSVAYDKNGRLVRRRDANGTLTDFVYHARGWLTQRTVRANADGSASAADATTVTDYDAVGNVIKVTDPDGVFVGYTYDAAHRLTDVTDAQGNRLHYTLDAAGNVTKEETFDVGGSVRRSLSRNYNTLGQLLKVVDAQNRTVQSYDFTDGYDANGNPVHSADALGIQRKQTYDALNRLVSTIDNYQGADTATKDTTSAFTYDARDNLEGVSDPDGLNTTYDYDGLGSLKALHSPDTGDTTYIHDAAGNTISQTDARGITRIMSYDALNRMSTVSYPDATQNATYHFDEANAVTGCLNSFPVGRLTRIVESNVTTVFCYDGRGNVTRKLQIVGSAEDTTTYAYTLANRLAGIGYPSGNQVAYARDANGRIQSVTLTTVGGNASAVASAVSYLPFGPIASYTLGNGQTVTRTYDANYRATDITSPALNLHFALDAMGDITALGNAPGASPAVETYSYDPLYHLTGVLGASSESYTYNASGDRLSKVGGVSATGAYTYQAGGHRLASVGSVIRSSDANGNTTGNVVAGEAIGFGYNDRNRMTVVQRGGRTVGTYVYNIFEQRVGKTASLPQPFATRYGYDQSGNLLGEYDTASRDYVWIDNLPIAAVDVAGSSTFVGYVFADALGTPRALTDTTGTVLWQWGSVSNPFGEQSPVSTGYVLNMRYPGQYFDGESGLSYNVHRNYEAGTGRYLQSDPIGLNGGLNSYVYVGSNPFAYTDLLGLNYAESWAAQGALIGGGTAFIGSVVLDVYTFGGNTLATVPEVAGGAAGGAALFGSAGALLDWATGQGASGAYAKAPDNAYDPNGPKAPGKPGPEDGFVDPKGGENWVPNPNPGEGGSSYGWQDSKGNVWCPTGQGGRAHGGPHWDVQTPGAGSRNVLPQR